MIIVSLLKALSGDTPLSDIKTKLIEQGYEIRVKLNPCRTACINVNGKNYVAQENIGELYIGEPWDSCRDSNAPNTIVNEIGVESMRKLLNGRRVAIEYCNE